MAWWPRTDWRQPHLTLSACYSFALYIPLPSSLDLHLYESLVVFRVCIILLYCILQCPVQGVENKEYVDTVSYITKRHEKRGKDFIGKAADTGRYESKIK